MTDILGTEQATTQTTDAQAQIAQLQAELEAEKKQKAGILKDLSETRAQAKTAKWTSADGIWSI